MMPDRKRYTKPWKTETTIMMTMQNIDFYTDMFFLNSNRFTSVVLHAQINAWNISLQWRHNGRDSVSNHQPHDCLLNRLFRRISKKTSKLRVAGLFAGNSPGTGEIPAQMASYAENVSIWRRHRGCKENEANVGTLIQYYQIGPSFEYKDNRKEMMCVNLSLFNTGVYV